MFDQRHLRERGTVRRGGGGSRSCIRIDRGIEGRLHGGIAKTTSAGSKDASEVRVRDYSLDE